MTRSKDVDPTGQFERAQAEVAGISHEAIPPKLDSIEPEAGGIPAGVKVKALEWVADHGVAGIGPYRLFQADSPLGKFTYGTDAEGIAYWHGAKTGVFSAGDEPSAKRMAEASWATLARREAQKYLELSASASPAPVAVPAGYRLVPDAARHAKSLREVAAVLSTERIQGWANPLVTLLTDAAEAIAPQPLPENAGQWVLSASPVPSTATQAGAVTEALRECQSALAMMIAPDAIKQTTVISAFAQATAAEAKARTVLSALASSPETARDRAERRVAELQAAGIRTLGDIERAQSSGERARDQADD